MLPEYMGSGWCCVLIPAAVVTGCRLVCVPDAYAGEGEHFAAQAISAQQSIVFFVRISWQLMEEGWLDLHSNTGVPAAATHKKQKASIRRNGWGYLL
jgi:hypothetical protein